MTDTLREAVERLRDECLRHQQAALAGGGYVSMISHGDVATRLGLILAAHPALDAEPGRCTCGLPGCSDEPNIVQRIANAWDCCGTCAGGVFARWQRAHDAALRTRVAGEIERDILAARRHMCEVTRTDPGHPLAQAYDDAASIARSAAEGA